MKKLRLNLMPFAVIVVSMLSLCGKGCREDDLDTLSVSISKLTFTADETEEKTVTITTSASTWTYDRPTSWVDAYKRDDDKLCVKVQKHNDSSLSRTATITITAGNAEPENITIEQEAKKINNLSVSPSSLTYDSNEIGDKTATVTSDAESWSATSDVSWVTTSKQNNTLTVKVATINSTSSERKANIKIIAGNAPEFTLIVSQGAKNNLSVSPNSLSYNATETGEKNVTITTNAENWSATTGVSWISLVKQNNILRVNVTSANASGSARKAEIRVTAGNATEQIVSVTQDAATTLSCSPTSLSFAYNETASKTTTVTTNASSWDATTPATWVSLTKSGNTLTVKPLSTNSSTSSRSAIITINAGNLSVTLTATQAGTTPVPGDNIPFPTSSYTATGSARFLESPGPGSWSGTITLVNSGQTNYYRLSGWGGRSLVAYLDLINGKIILDGTTKIVDDSSDISTKGYFKAVVIDFNDSTWDEVENYQVNYNSSTRTLDFSGKHAGYDVLVGIVAIKNTDLIGVYTELYANAKLVLTPTSNAPQLSGDKVVKSAVLSGNTLYINGKAFKKSLLKK